MINGKLRAVAEDLDSSACFLPATTNEILRLIGELCLAAKEEGVSFEAHDDNGDWENTEELLIDVVLSGHVQIGPCIDLANKTNSNIVIVC